MSAYYNENDPFAAAWLRELIKAGLIADGEVDERSIELVRPNDLRGFVQCHFFAGIGGWSHALRLASWGDDRPVWTGSCPCQPFSSAGAQAGGHDSRDLWPVWFELVRECRPVVVFGEQVEAAVGHGWLDRLCDDLEAEDYAIGACGLPGPSVGAFDIRQRLWFVADAERRTSERHGHEMAGAASQVEGGTPERERLWTHAGDGCHFVRVADAEHAQQRWPQYGPVEDECDVADTGRPQAHSEPGARREVFWADAEWIACIDGKARPVEPGTFPLAHGVSARVGRLRGYGNAIKPQVAQVFIEAYMSLNR